MNKQAGSIVGFPLFDHIDKDKRLTLIDRLQRWQQKHHGTELEVTTVIKKYLATGGWPIPAGQDVNIDAPSYEEQNIIDLNTEMSQPPSRRDVILESRPHRDEESQGGGRRSPHHKRQGGDDAPPL
jgi:hypothetical protein